MEEAVRQALRIGAERSIIGHLRGGFATWAEAGGPIESSGHLTVSELARKIEELVLWRPKGGALEGTPNKFVRSGDPR